mgnify:CR=1 FL=1
MCGIAGFIAGHGAANATALAPMLARIAHRGPDGQGTFVEGPAALGHCRLAIIDLDGGAQPLYSEDKNLVVVFNGEIYNYRALTAELTALEKWVKDRRAAYFTEKLVEPNAAKAPDDMGIIDFAETDGAIAEGETTYTAGEYASRIAGVLAGIPAGMSATYAPLTELTAVTPRSTQEQAAAIKAGKLILIHDGVKAKIARGVNSLTTIPATGKADWSKIKIVEGMDLLTYYLRTTIQDQYVGRYANTYDNKCVLVTAIQTFLAELEGQGVLSSGESWAELDAEAQEKWMRSQGIETADMTAQEIKEYQTGSWVFVRVGGRFVDAMEDFQLSVDNL